MKTWLIALLFASLCDAFIPQANDVPGFSLKIEKTWNDQPINHPPIEISFHFEVQTPKGKPVKRIIRANITAPYFNDPPGPNVPPGTVMDLYNYEVVEMFFSSADNKYVEMEVGPHGHFLVLLLDGERKAFSTGLLNLTTHAEIHGNMWKASVEIPLAYMPPYITKMNAYGIHGSGQYRTYEAWSPTPYGKFSYPDFHRLEYFRHIDRTLIIPASYGGGPWPDYYYGDLWKGHY